MVFSIEDRELKFRKFIKLRITEPRKEHILREIGISEKTYREWCRIDDNEELFITLPRKGGPNKKTSTQDDQTLREAALENNWSDLGDLRQIPEIDQNQRIASVSDRTIRRRLRDTGVRHRVAAFKERLLNFHRANRLNYANQFINWSLIDWSRIIFIDEFSICTGDRGRLWVWREKNTRYSEQNIALIQNTRRFSVSFIACFHGMGPLHRIGRLTMESYAEFLENSLFEYIERHFDDGNVLLLHDNHPVHNSNHVKEWISANIGDIQDFVLPHPSLSPDLNPDENVGAMIKGLVRSQRPVINSQDELWTALEEAHRTMCDISWRQYFINLLNSMPKRLQEVIAAEGGHTSY